MKLTGKKLILLLLYTPVEGDRVNIPIAGRTRLMKMGFLFKEEVLGDFQKDRTFNESILPDYFGWKYGPFSSGFLNDLEFLVNQSYVHRIENERMLSDLVTSQEELIDWEYDFWIEDMDEFQSKQYNEEVFELTQDKGVVEAKKIWDILSKNQKMYLREFKEVLNRAPLSRILDYVYKKYRKDGYVDKSLIRERYLS